MEDEQPQGLIVDVLGELQHRDVTVGVSCRKQRPPTDPWLLGQELPLLGRHLGETLTSWRCTYW
jgi:hypothetical protein